MMTFFMVFCNSLLATVLPLGKVCSAHLRKSSSLYIPELLILRQRALGGSD